MIDGDTKLIAHIGYPTASFRAPSIYNPWFRRRGINAAVVPLGVRSENFREAFPQICRFSNFHGALITMPHKAEWSTGSTRRPLPCAWLMPATPCVEKMMVS